MNEDELKQLWNKDKTQKAPAINFSALEGNLRGWEAKLRRKIKIDIFFNAAVYVLLVPFVFIYPRVLHLAPLIVFIWVWYLWETLRIYRQDKEFTLTTRQYLETKKRYLQNYITRTRWILYVLSPLCAFGGVYVVDLHRQILQSPVSTAALLIFSFAFMILIVEIYVRKVYQPSVNELKELLAQLDSNNN